MKETQGSILGPLLFIIFINDLKSYIKSGHFVNFADDANIAIRARTIQELEEKQKLAMKEMKDWSHSNKLCLNETQTNVVQFRTNERVLKTVNSDFKDLQVNEAKFLGIFVDEHLRWNYHIKTLKTKCNKAIFSIRKIKELTNTKTALMVYFALFHSIISYGTLIWGNSVTSIELFKLQKKPIRSVLGLSQMHSCRLLFKDLNVMTLPSIYIFEMLKYVKFNEKDFVKNQDIHGQNTRFKSDLRTNTCRLKISQNNVFSRGVLLFNKLPIQIRELNYDQFKKKMKTYLVDKTFYSVSEFQDSKF